MDLLAAFFIPEVAAMIHPFVGMLVPAIAEISMLLYLLIIGVKTDEKTLTPGERIVAAAQM